MAVAFDDEFLGRFHRADLRHPASVVAAQIQEHQMLGQLFRVGQQFGLERAILFRRFSPWPGPGNRPDGDFAIEDPHQNFRAGPDHLKTTEVEKEHERRRVGAAQTAVQRKRRQGEFLAPALRRHDLKYVARADIFLGRLDRGEILGFGEIRHRRRRLGGLAQTARRGGRRTLEIAHRVHHPFTGLRIGRARVLTVAGPDRGDHRHLALDAVHDHHHRGPQHHRIGQVERVGVDVWQVFDQPDNVVT